MLVAALFSCTAAYADGPLRGNPVDALPPIEPPTESRPPAPALQVPPTPEQRALQARLAQTIVPRHFDVSGVRAIPFEEVAAYLGPLAGKEIRIADLVREVDKITLLYRERGYPLSFALLQNQSFEDGLVVVTVVEGHVAKVSVQGDIGNAAARLQALSEPLVQEKPLTRATLERVLNLMRTVPGVTIEPALDLPRRADGATELVLQASRNAVRANAGLVDLGKGMQPLVNVSSNSLTPLGEQVRLTSSVPLNTDDVRYYAAEARVPLGRDGLALKVDGYHYRSEPEDDALEYLGFDRKVTNDRIGAGLSYPFVLDNRRSLTGTLGLYAVNGKDRYTLRDSDRWLQQNTRVRAATAELRYIDALPTRSTDITLSVSKGFDAAGAQKSIESNYGYSATPDIDLDFTRFNLSARQSFTLPAGLGLVLAASGQYSADRLPSSEQVSYGSWRYAMGYPQGDQSGDKGLGASMELNRRVATGWRYVAAVQPYALVDYARTWYNDPALQALNRRHLSSVALGLRFTDDKYYLFDFNMAQPVGSRPYDADRGLRFNANYSVFYDAL